MHCRFLLKTGDPAWEDLLRDIEAAGPSGAARDLIESVAAEAGVELRQAGTAAVDRVVFAGAESFAYISA
jgi:hypothetical protein